MWFSSMWFDTVLWLVAFAAFIAVEAATTALVSVWFAVSAQAFGEDFFDLFAKWTSEIFHLDDSAKPEASIGHNDLEEGEVREYATPQEMLNDFGIKGQLIPTEVPEEFGAPTCWASGDRRDRKSVV